MPGGRGTILDVANALNGANADQVAEAVKAAVNTGYRLSQTSVPLVGAAFALSNQPDKLMDVWCHANDQGSIDWVDY